MLLFALFNAYRIRTYALKEYGMVIHEFDPWFNFRATQYLAKHGWRAFFHWYDHMSWYPLGRPVDCAPAEQSRPFAPALGQTWRR